MDPVARRKSFASRLVLFCLKTPGYRLYDCDRDDEAEPLLLEAIKRRPRPISYARLGAIFARKQDAVKALEYYERFLELAEKSDPERPRAVSAVKKLKPARKR
jgi:tetratricopeptide (TPR) repeat protein